MDFRLTAEDEAFLSELRTFFDEELPAEWQRVDDKYGFGTAEAFAMSREFSRRLATRGWLAMAWPKEYGGLGATYMQQMLFNEEVAYRRVPGAFSMGVAWVGPALIHLGTEEQKQEYLPRITGADDVWCTLYSEPGAGSDLAALQTRAVLDGDEWVINGQKIWTSGAHHSNKGWLAARTDPGAPKHRGISMFILDDMRAPGITIQPLINMANDHSFNQVFFEDVRISKKSLVGELNRGWYHLALSLDFERSSIAGASNARRMFEDLIEDAREHRPELARRPEVRARLAEAAIEIEVGRMLSYRVVSMQMRGLVPNHEASAAKLYSTELAQRVALIGVQLLGLYGPLEGASAHHRIGGRMAYNYLATVSATIAGGTSEIQRGIVAMRGLGLPRG